MQPKPRPKPGLSNRSHRLADAIKRDLQFVKEATAVELIVSARNVHAFPFAHIADCWVADCAQVGTVASNGVRLSRDVQPTLSKTTGDIESIFV